MNFLLFKLGLNNNGSIHCISLVLVRCCRGTIFVFFFAEKLIIYHVYGTFHMHGIRRQLKKARRGEKKKKRGAKSENVGLRAEEKLFTAARLRAAE